MNRSRREDLAQREELIQQREEAAGKLEEALRMREEAVEKREEAVTMREKAVRGREGALQEKEEAMEKWVGEMQKKEQKLSKLEQAHKKKDKQTEPIRASAAGSSSPPRQPPVPGPATHVHDLPDEVLAKIFALLNLKTIAKVLSVCQRWRDVIEDRNLIKCLVLEGGKITTQEALCLIHSAQKMKSLELVCRSDTVALLDAASHSCTNLLHLSVDFRNASDSLTDVLTKVFQSNPRIINLRLMCNSVSINPMFYQELGTALPDLRKLQVWTDQFSALELNFLIDSCRHNQMEEFKLCNCLFLDSHIAKLVQFWGRSLRVLELYASELTDGALAQLAVCSELRRLKLLDLHTTGDWVWGLTGLSYLEALHVSNATNVKQENWYSFFSQSRSSIRLRKIYLDSCTGVDDRVLASVAAFCPQVEELKVASIHVTISGVRQVLRCCHKLRNLYLDTDAGVGDIVPELPQLAPQLRRIRFGCNVGSTMDEATLRRVQVQMPHLTIELPTLPIGWI